MDKNTPASNEELIKFLIKLVEEKSVNNDHVNEATLSINKNTELLRSGMIDSFDLVEIITMAEEEFDINLDYENTTLGSVTICEIAKNFDLK